MGRNGDHQSSSVINCPQGRISSLLKLQEWCNSNYNLSGISGCGWRGVLEVLLYIRRELFSGRLSAYSITSNCSFACHLAGTCFFASALWTTSVLHQPLSWVKNCPTFLSEKLFPRCLAWEMPEDTRYGHLSSMPKFSVSMAWTL